MLGVSIGMPYGINILLITGSARKATFVFGTIASMSIFISSFVKTF